MLQATELVRSMHKLRPMLEKELASSLAEYEQLAVGLIESVSASGRDQSLAASLLFTPLPQWGDRSALQLARSARCKQFLSSDVAQGAVGLLWSGHLRDLSVWTITGRLLWECLPAIFTCCCRAQVATRIPYYLLSTYLAWV